MEEVLATPVMQETIQRLLGVVATEGENNKRRQTLLTAYAAPSRDDHWRNLNMTGSFRDFWWALLHYCCFRQRTARPRRALCLVCCFCQKMRAACVMPQRITS